MFEVLVYLALALFLGALGFVGWQLLVARDGPGHRGQLTSGAMAGSGHGEGALLAPRPAPASRRAVWLVVPAATVAALLVLTVRTVAFMSVEPGQAVTVEAIARGGAWEFFYPDLGLTTSRLVLPQGRNVVLHLLAEDRKTTFYSPQLFVKQDAEVGRVRELWMSPKEKGIYGLECDPPCEPITVMARSEFDRWEAQQVATARGDERPVADVYLEVSLLEAGGESSRRPWSIGPREIVVRQGQKVAIRVTNPGGQGAGHDIAFEGLDAQGHLVAPGQSTWVIFIAPAPGTYTYYCTINGHKNLGMVGQLVVTP